MVGLINAESKGKKIAPYGTLWVIVTGKARVNPMEDCATVT